MFVGQLCGTFNNLLLGMVEYLMTTGRYNFRFLRTGKIFQLISHNNVALHDIKTFSLHLQYRWSFIIPNSKQNFLFSNLNKSPHTDNVNR